MRRPRLAAASSLLSLGLANPPGAVPRTLLLRFMRRAWPGVNALASRTLMSGGEQLMGGLLRRSALPRRSREIPFVLDARGPE